MAPVHLPVSSSVVPWPTSDDRDRSSSGGALPVREPGPTTSGALVMSVGTDAHDAIDHTAAHVAPTASPVMGHHQRREMSNPWLKKNPFMSMWLSTANRVAGTMRGQATAQAERNFKAAMDEAKAPPAPKAKPQRKR